MSNGVHLRKLSVYGKLKYSIFNFFVVWNHELALLTGGDGIREVSIRRETRMVQLWDVSVVTK